MRKTGRKSKNILVSPKLDAKTSEAVEWAAKRVKRPLYIPDGVVEGIKKNLNPKTKNQTYISDDFVKRAERDQNAKAHKVAQKFSPIPKDLKDKAAKDLEAAYYQIVLGRTSLKDGGVGKKSGRKRYTR